MIYIYIYIYTPIGIYLTMIFLNIIPPVPTICTCSPILFSQANVKFSLRRFEKVFAFWVIPSTRVSVSTSGCTVSVVNDNKPLHVCTAYYIAVGIHSIPIGICIIIDLNIY